MIESGVGDESERGTVVGAGSRWWRRAPVVLGGIVALALLLASESLGAGTIFNVTLHYPGIDKVAHLVQYALVSLSVWWLMGGVVAHRVWRVAAAAAVALLLGLGDEFFQRLVANRTFEVADLAANACGVMLGMGLGPGIPSRRVARALVAAALVGTVGVAGHSYLRLRHFNRGMLYTRQGDLPKALHEYRLAREDGLDSPGFYNELAWIELESGVGDARAAVGYASRALAATPHSADVLDTFGWALHQSGRSREALPPLERAFAAKPRMYCIHYHLGEVYAALGDTDRAAHHLREQIRLFPGGSDARRAAQALRQRRLAPATAQRATGT
ncbi:MAG: VanZ family protein [Vicinamibacteraceae bacterium]